MLQVNGYQQGERHNQRTLIFYFLLTCNWDLHEWTSQDCCGMWQLIMCDYTLIFLLKQSIKNEIHDLSTILLSDRRWNHTFQHFVHVKQQVKCTIFTQKTNHVTCMLYKINSRRYKNASFTSNYYVSKLHDKMWNIFGNYPW